MTVLKTALKAGLSVEAFELPDLKISTLQAAYQQGLKPSALIAALLPKLAEDAHGIWIQQLDSAWLLDYAGKLDAKNPADLPLYGIPFAIKDNIDLAGVPTTAACPDFSYVPQQSATVVQKLLDAGAIPLGKTNLDQFATGLNGTRSPYAVAKNSINPDYISGGSSSGSALAVALGLASFSLGTDTAGSGRVPAAFNNLIGVKPSCGLLSTSGVVPACRTLDSVSIFTKDTADAHNVLDVAQGFDATDAYSKKITLPAAKAVTRIGIPCAHQLQFFNDAEYARLFAQAVEQLKAQGFQLVEVDFEPFLNAAQLLYAGPWVAERYHVVAPLLAKPDAQVLPVIKQIVSSADKFSAEDCFKAFYQLAAYKRQAEQILATVDVMLTPTAGTIYKIDDMLINPVQLNSNLGYYTNFMNLLDFAALAVPAGFRPDGLPFGITFFADAGQDLSLLALAQQLEPVL
jgi:allophanate hydrolase